MKTFSHLFSKVTSLENLFQAWGEFKKGKRKKIDVGCFEKSLEDNLFQLREKLTNKSYRHAAYTGFYIRDPKVRRIHKAIVADRIVHHALFNILSPIFEPTFISDAFSCRKGYGTHKGFKKLVVYLRKISRNYTRDVWALKGDIRKFFDSVDHQILLDKIAARVKDDDLMWLIKEIIGSYQTVIGKGLPIGNLTSQLFANIYLDDFDQFIKHKLKAKYYLRYADDFVLLNQDKDFLVQAIGEIKHFLEGYGLNLHDKKVVLRMFSWGIDFVGYVALPYYQLLRTKTRKRMFRRVYKKIRDYKAGLIEPKALDQSLKSYLGLLSHAHTFKLKRDLARKIVSWKNG